MTTAKELKDFIALDSAVAEDGLFKKLGAAVKGAISGAKAGFAGGGSASAQSEGDGKATGKGKYGLQHPDGTPCDAKKPESCPIMRKQLAEQEEAGKKEEPSASGSAAEEEKKADKADDLSKESPSAESKKDDNWGGKFPVPHPKDFYKWSDPKKHKELEEAESKKEEDKPITIKKVDKPAEEAKEDKPITIHKVVGGEKSGKEAAAKGRWVTPEDERAKADAEYFKKLDDKKREEAKKAEAAKEAAAKKEADDRKAEHEADVAKVKERDAAEPSIPVSKPSEESLTDLTAKWDTAAKVCTERNQALRKAIADGAGKDEIARLQKDVHDANTALSKIGEKIDAHHKKSLDDAKKGGDDDDGGDGPFTKMGSKAIPIDKSGEPKKKNDNQVKMAMLDKAIKDGTEREHAFYVAAGKEGIPASAKEHYIQQMKAAREEINKAIDEKNELLKDPKSYEGMSVEELNDEYAKVDKESQRLYAAERDLMSRPSYAGKREDLDKARAKTDNAMERQAAIRTALKKATASDDAKKYIDGLKSSSGKKTPSQEAKTVRDAFSSADIDYPEDPDEPPFFTAGGAEKITSSCDSYLKKEGLDISKSKAYISEGEDQGGDIVTTGYYDVCMNISEGQEDAVKKIFTKLSKATGRECSYTGRWRKSKHRDGSNFRARIGWEM